jgi:beta-phosphoglucomutase family hydrolase
MTAIEAVIFDMDGVLVDSEPLHTLAWQKLLDAQGCHLDAEFFLAWVGIPDRKLAEHLRTQRRTKLPVEELLFRKRNLYRILVSEELRPMPGVLEGLRSLHGMPLAVATSSARLEAYHTLTAVGLIGCFKSIVGAEDVLNHKPAPDVFLRAAELLGSEPVSCVVIEDSLSGVEAGRAAGCTVLAVSSTLPAEKLNRAHEVLPATSDAIRWILERTA